MTRAAWDRLLAEAHAVHAGHAGLSGFCPFPDDLRPQTVEPFDVPAAGLMYGDTGLTTDQYSGLRDGFLQIGPLAQWRETYKDTDIAQDFMDRFGCYCLIGNGGAYHSDRMWAWVVYMPAGLWYPWHHHPGEEMYMILAGEAEFRRVGHDPEILRPGDCVLHESNQSHATLTHDRPMMAYVVWRNGFDTPPVLTGADGVS